MKINEFQGEYRFLSNFWPAKVGFEGSIYPSVEHAYQAAKTLDMNAREHIRNLDTAGKAKRAGQLLKIRSDWEKVKLGIMEDLVKRKFQDAELKKKLLATGDAELVEGNKWGDIFWGVSNGKGQNHLGRILMKVRSDLQK